MNNGRLTYRGNNGKGYVRAKQYYDGVYTQLENVAERLTAYEDAIPFADLPRAAELYKADLEGRVPVLPVPFGAGKVVFGIEQDDLYEDVPKSIATIDCEEIEHMEIWPTGELIITVDGWEIGKTDIGDTIFLTRAEAEAALSAQQCGNADCPYQERTDCPAADGCGGFEAALAGGDGDADSP